MTDHATVARGAAQAGSKVGTGKSRKATRHEAVLCVLLEMFPAAKRNGFRAALRKLYAAESDFDAEEMAEAVQPITPDAFWIDMDKRQILAFEVEDQHPLPKARFIDYIVASMWARDADFNLVIVFASRWGAIAYIEPYEVHQANLRAWGEKENAKAEAAKAAAAQTP